MNVKITGETELLIKAALASGAYASAEEFIAAMASQYQARDANCDLPRLPKGLAGDVLAAAQRVGSIQYATSAS